MTQLQRFFGYLTLGTSIYGAYFFTSYCPSLYTAGQGMVVLLARLLIGTPINIVCLLIFLVLTWYAILEKIKNSSQVFGIEAGLVWKAILILNAWFFIGMIFC